jgi:hypothetical protein
VNAEKQTMRRVVTGHDAQGRSCVLFDSDAPNVKYDNAGRGGGMTEFWRIDSMPTVLGGARDDGQPPFTPDPPQHGGFLRFVYSLQAPVGFDAANDPRIQPEHPPIEDPVTGRGERGGRRPGRSITHRTRSIDYGFVAAGRRTLILDDCEVPLGKGDVVIQLANYHAWSNPESDSLVGYVMIGARFD